MPVFTVPIDEANDCHTPAGSGAGGQFCSDAGPTIQVGGRTIAVELSKYAKRVKEELVVVDVAKFDAAWARDRNFHIDKAGTNKIGDRLARIEAFLKTAPMMAASEVTVRDTGGVIFSDGRHRFAYLRDLGLKHIPVSMDKESVRNAKKHRLLVTS
jgi:hypothetical protein